MVWMTFFFMSSGNLADAFAGIAGFAAIKSPPKLEKLTSKIATSSIECGFWCFKSNLGH